MKNLLVIREQIRNIYGKYEFIITPIYKFLLAVISLAVINSKLGYFDKIDSAPIVIVAGLFCSFMPTNVITLLDGLFILLHMYALSMASLIVVGLVFLLLVLLYFRFSPKETLSVVSTPVLFIMKIPYVSPVVCGLVGSPTSIFSVGTGTIIYFVCKLVKANAVALSTAEDEALVAQFKMLIDGIIKNEEMIIWIVAFSVTIILVYMIRRLAVNHSWTIAMIAGAITDIVILLMGALVFDMDISFIGALFGTLIAVGIAKVIEFFKFNVDYNRTEYVQYEDDEYYYYVKAVPKNVVAKPEKSVKKVSSATKQLPLIDRDTLKEHQEEEKKATEESADTTGFGVNGTGKTNSNNRYNSNRNYESRNTGSRNNRSSVNRKPVERRNTRPENNERSNSTRN